MKTTSLLILGALLCSLPAATASTVALESLEPPGFKIVCSAPGRSHDEIATYDLRSWRIEYREFRLAQLQIELETALEAHVFTPALPGHQDFAVQFDPVAFHLRKSQHFDRDSLEATFHAAAQSMVAAWFPRIALE